MIGEIFNIDASPALSALRKLDESLVNLAAGTQLLRNSFERITGGFEQVEHAAEKFHETLDLGGELMDACAVTSKLAGIASSA